MNEKSCVGCKFLWADGDGYSDYTWMETFLRCAKDRNVALAKGDVHEPYDWITEPDNLPATMNGRCDLYSAGPHITVSPDGFWDDEPIDDEQKAAIGEHREYREE
jgi:hypothetical protein